MNPKVDEFLNEAKSWQKEMEALRMLLLDCQLTEEFKWGTPCYMAHKGNILLLGAFKEYVVLSFFKGALLTDPEGILEKPGENTQIARIISFSTLSQIKEMETVLKAYILEAIELEKSGAKPTYTKAVEMDIPVELQEQLDKNPALKTAFEALTDGRKKGYLLHFAAPKQSQTRTARVEKCIERILLGKGLNDCTCGLSKKMPACDGSHKILSIE